MLHFCYKTGPEGKGGVRWQGKTYVRNWFSKIARYFHVNITYLSTENL